ncbi:MAG: hypothetical protein B6U76_07485 [Desulfurococcales archaeon ex4484_217_2]|nr:MAG: hypothetical protein B6U76_07485 [Desulfurococcales archaeon ex4484_217_2]
MNTSSILIEKCKELAKKNEALANEFRVLILVVLDKLGESSWSKLKNELENILRTPINPNLLAFHLRKLVNMGFVKRIETESETLYKPTIPDEYKHLIEQVLKASEAK